MKIVVLSGAGVSAASGLKTFRDDNGLWENHRIEDVATPAAWKKDREMVLRFYNQRRVQLGTVQPNAAHLAIASWQERHEVLVVTQNVDDLHERAGSRQVLHLHGKLTEVRSSNNPTWVMDVGYREVVLGEKCPGGAQLRPNIVWFGEDVPAIPKAVEWVRQADVLVVVGTSLRVYPAASLVDHAPDSARCVYVDPKPGAVPDRFKVVTATAEQGLPALTEWLETLV